MNVDVIKITGVTTSVIFLHIYRYFLLHVLLLNTFST